MVEGKAAAPGLRFVGYVPRPAGIYYYGKRGEARQAKEIARELAAFRAPRSQPQSLSGVSA